MADFFIPSAPCAIFTIEALAAATANRDEIEEFRGPQCRFPLRGDLECSVTREM